MAIWDRFKNDNLTGFETEVQSGAVWYPMAYCDDPDMEGVYVGDGKPPVCKLSLDPVTQHLNEPIAWDISTSMSSTSTIEEFSIDWGGDTDIGNLSNQDWFSDPLSGEVVYDEVGIYEVEAWVVDLLGVESQHVFITVEITPPEPEPSGLAAAGSGGSFYSAATLGGTWTERITGLTEGQLDFEDFIVDPFSFDLNEFVYDPDTVILHGSGPGFSVYTEDSGQTWLDFTPYLPVPTNDWADSPAPAVSTVTFKKVVGDWFEEGIFYRLVNWQNSDGNWRAWVYYTLDNGITHIIYPLSGELQAYGLGIDIDKGDGGVLWVTSWEGGEGDDTEGNLILRKYLVGTELTLEEAIVLSTDTTVTAASDGSGESVVYPFAPDGGTDFLYLYGRFAVEFEAILITQLAYTDDGAASITSITMVGFTEFDTIPTFYAGPDEGGREIWLTRQDHRPEA
jgi:hypothetical protein